MVIETYLLWILVSRNKAGIAGTTLQDVAGYRHDIYTRILKVP